METIKPNIDWFDKILPDGLPIKSTTIITGPGGSGKPLIGEYFLASWLKNGGSVVVMSLQYPSPEFVTTSVKNITGVNFNDYAENVVFLQLNTEIQNLEQTDKQLINANLVKPEVWNQAINLATKQLPIKGPGILVFASALNILLFSPSYGEAIFSRIKETIRSNTHLTYIISVSNSAKKEEIAQLEEMADNLIVSRSEKDPFQLYMKIERLKSGQFDHKEIQIPVSADTLNHFKEISKHSRGRVLPAIKKI
ncbi:ATPase domain-containing protein [Marinilabilia salmonicolor]|uniref:ATPase domain-containing protein n=1 Tax=Marinilabilia salmonicolor TaxID=989 RepID=UPI00029A6547|nr:ATPase domain-containing protein [Marinilabilia salmonicolor]